jgi:hypothetical protein
MDRPTGIYLQTMTGKEVQARLEKNDLSLFPSAAPKRTVRMPAAARILSS